MMLPLLLGDYDSSDQNSTMDLLVLMMAMQSQAPNSAFGTDIMLPLLLMEDSSDNEALLFFMMMGQGKTKCEPEVVPQEQEVKTVFRSWRVNADGTRELIEENISVE